MKPPLLQIIVVTIAAALAALGGFLTTSGRSDATEERDRAQELHDQARERQDEQRATAERLSRLIGLPVEIGKDSATLDDVENFADREFFEDYRPTPFGMVGLANGFAFRVVSAERVERGTRTWEEQEGKLERLPEIRTSNGVHLVRIELDVINRSGGADDPACGMVGELEAARVVLVDNAVANRGSEAGRSADTYIGSCIRSLPDGTRGKIAVYWGVLGDDERIVAFDPDFQGWRETNPIAAANEEAEFTTGERPSELLLMLPKPT